MAISGLQFVLVHVIFNFMIIAKLWGSIQDGQTLMTVGKAIGFLFIPLFNFYWVARVWGSYPTEYNNYADRHNLNNPRLSRKFFIFYPVLQNVRRIFLPFLLALPGLVLMSVFAFMTEFLLRGAILLLIAAIILLPFLLMPFVFIAAISKTCDAVNALKNVMQNQQIGFGEKSQVENVINQGQMQGQYIANT